MQLIAIYRPLSNSSTNWFLLYIPRTAVEKHYVNSYIIHLQLGTMCDTCLVSGWPEKKWGAYERLWYCSCWNLHEGEFHNIKHKCINTKRVCRLVSVHFIGSVSLTKLSNWIWFLQALDISSQKADEDNVKVEQNTVNDLTKETGLKC